MIPTREQIGALMNSDRQILSMLGGGQQTEGQSIPEALESIAKAVKGLQTVVHEYPVEKDVNFIDYDGQLLYSYTAEEFAGLTGMPDNPVHEGLTAQGWNWELADAKTYVEDVGKLWIGQTYITDDGKTRFFITIPDGLDRSFKFRLGLNGTAEIDWGDGSETETLTGDYLHSDSETQTHTYPETGDYIISIRITGRARLNCTQSGASAKALFYTDETVGKPAQQQIYCNMLRKVEFGENIVLDGNYIFGFCESLKAVVLPLGLIPSSPGKLPYYAFYNCYELKAAVIPGDATGIDDYCFQDCYGLARISLPKGITNIGNSAFNYCESLKSITIPENAAFGSYGAIFDSCHNLEEVRMHSNLSKITTNMFRLCRSLEDVEIPAGVTEIERYAFTNCNGLRKRIEIPDGVTTIGDSAFNSCYCIPAFIIPASITTIGTGAFASCSGLHEIHFRGSVPPAVSGASAFTGLPEICKIYVPSGSLAAYQAAANYPDSSVYTYIEE